MQHTLTIGFFDPEAAGKGTLQIIKPLAPEAVRACLSSFPGVEWDPEGLRLGGRQETIPLTPVLKLLYLDFRGNLIRTAVEIAARLQKELGCVVADYQNGRLYSASDLQALTQRRS